MESVPLIPKAKVFPNLDTVPLLQQLFQNEFQEVVPAKNLSQNILTSLQYQKACGDNKETFRSVEFLGNLTDRKDNVIDFTENVLEAYSNHQEKLDDIRDAEKHIFETHAEFLKRQVSILEDKSIRDLVSLKRQPLFKSLDLDYVKKYKLLQGEVYLPPEYELHSDFQVKNFKRWKKRLETSSQGALILGCLSKAPAVPTEGRWLPVKSALSDEPKKVRKARPKNKKVQKKPEEILSAEPKIVFFTEYKVGDVYIAEINVKNIDANGLQFQLKPTCPNGPFKVMLGEKSPTKVFPGLSFQLIVEFTPKSLDNVAEDVVIVTEDGNRLLIPLIAYLEPPILKTHKEVDEFTKTTAERIASSYIECGACFTGDTRVTKLRFHCYRGSGEFFIMSLENWSRSYINTVTSDNLLEIPPFHVYPVYFKIKKDEVIDLYVEFKPKNSGTHVENIVIACNNGEIRFLDLLGDAVGWHSYYFSFQDSLLKTLPAEKDDDTKVKYYLDFEDSTPTGKVEKKFCVRNNSNMAFEFQWKVREANIQTHEKYMKLSKFEVKINPESGTFEKNSIWEFAVTITFNNAEIGHYRMVLSLYVLNIPYQCIEEDNTIIQPTGLVRNLYSQSLYGEEEGPVVSPDLASLQGTYESLQESIKSYVECQTKAQSVQKNDFCRTTCIPNPGLCAKPLKKSKTFFNIGAPSNLSKPDVGTERHYCTFLPGNHLETRTIFSDNVEDEGLSCICRLKVVEPESNSESCISNTRDERMNQMSPQRNEVIWDFVDVLVDEVELWVEVVPVRVTLDPCVLEFGTSLKVHDPPVFRRLRVISHIRTPLICTWVTSPEINDTKTLASNKDQISLSLLFDKNSGKKEKFKENSRNSITVLKCTADDEKKEKNDENCEFEGENNEKGMSQSCKFTIKPQKTFLLAGYSEHICEIGISACQPGNIKQTLCLSINKGDFELKVLILGSASAEDFYAFPEILDFGVLKQGTRYKKDFKIINRGQDSLFWSIKQYEFDFKEEKFLSPLGLSDSPGTKTNEEVVMKEENSESFCLDARVPGIKCFILEVEVNKGRVTDPKKDYILVLGDVKRPKLFLSAPRFENAILSPTGKMYVGQKIITEITLTNIGPVETFFSWGHSFGCHSRKIKVDITPKSFRIERKKKLSINLELTALEEGIISHCYLPCFFCRSKEPLILSIVALAEKVNVTFEIIDYPLQTHTDAKSLLKSPFHHTVLRIPWPLKVYNPTLNQKYVNENDVMSMRCRCLEVEEEAIRAFDERKQDTVPELAGSEKSVRSTLSFEISDESSLKSKSSIRKINKSSCDEDLKLSTSVLSGCAESKKSEENSLPICTFAQSSSETFRFVKSELEFLNVPFRKPIKRQFVIRNETPISTSFRINVLHFGVSKTSSHRRIEEIKNKVMGHSKDEFEGKIRKDQPLVIVVEPSEGELSGLDAVCVNVFCYGNTWGEYRDLLICQIKGIETFHLKMFIQIVGHPLYFPMLKTQSVTKPVLWFQPLNHVEEPASKQIKVVNRSAIPLTVSWIVFLTKPLSQEEEPREDCFNSCFESFHSAEDSLKSSKNYIPKNTSESVSSFRYPLEVADSSQNSGKKYFEKSESSNGKKENRNSDVSVKKFSVPSVNEETKPTDPPARQDTQIFQVEPKKMDFEPFEEKKIIVTFDPRFGNKEISLQEFKAVLTGCVKLKPENEKYPGVFNRPCGINFVSELMDFNAMVEKPIVFFEILRGDLKFIINSNAVIKSQRKEITVSRKFLFKNKNQQTLHLKIENVPGVIFRVTNVKTIDKYYPNYNPDKHNLKVEPGHLLEIELQCSVSYKDVIYAFEQLKQRRKKDQCPISSYSMGALKRASSENNDESKPKTQHEPWNQYFNCFCQQKRFGNRDNSLSHRDSFDINVNRMSSNSANSICADSLEKPDYNIEVEGEFLELPKAEEIPCKAKSFQNETVIEEEITFVQSGLVTQALLAELHLSFPAIKISPKNLDFGNVYLGETAVRYCSFINLTAFPMNFRVKAKCGAAEFTASPLTGSLPPGNYNLDIGQTITIEFKPQHPGYFKEIFYIYCNENFEFDFYELFVAGFGTWNEKYRTPKLEIYTKLQGIYPKLQNDI